MAGNDLRSMTDETKSILMNADVIAIDQDSAGIGTQAGTLALFLVEQKKPVPPEKRVLAPKLVVRASSRRK